jgi:hypothetical protein
MRIVGNGHRRGKQSFLAQAEFVACLDAEENLFILPWPC